MLKNLFLTFILIITLFSCAKEESDNLDLASFSVDTINSYSLNLIFDANQENSEIVDIKNKAVYSANVCIKDPANNRGVVSERFSYLIGSESSQVKQFFTTDLNGCGTIIFEESVDYKSCEKFIERNIKIKGEGNYFGQVVINLSLNPKAYSSKALYDLRATSVPLINSCEKSSFIDLSTTTVNKLSDELFSFEFKHSFKFKDFASDGPYHEIQLKNLNSLKMNYFLTYNIGSEYFLIDEKNVELINNQGENISSVRFDVPSLKKLNFDKIVIFYSFLDPVTKMINVYSQESIDLTFKSLKSVIRLGDLPNFVNSNSDNDYKDNQLFNENPIGHTLSTINISNILFSKSNSISNKDKLVKKSLTFSSCIVDEISGNPVLKAANKFATIKFSNKEVNLNSTKVKIDQNSCFSIDLSLAFNNYGKNSWQYSDLSLNLDDININLQVAFHPSSSKIHFVDLRKTKISEVESLNDDMEIFVDTLSYGQVGNENNSFYVNKFLELFMEKRYFLEFRPVLINKNSGNKTNTTEVLNEGAFDIELAIYVGQVDGAINSVDLKKFNTIATSKIEAQVSATGLVKAEFKLPLVVNDAIFLSQRAFLIMRLIPKNIIQELSEKKFVFDFYGTSFKESATVNEGIDTTNLDWESLNFDKFDHFNKGLHNKTDKNSIDLYKDYLIKNQMLSSKNYFLLNDFLTSSLHTESEAKLNAYDFRILKQVTKTIPKTGGLREKICRLFYPGKLKYFTRNECIDDPSKFVTINSGTHIDDILPLNLFEQQNKLVQANYLNQLEENDGDVSRGKGYMVAAGDRAGISSGTHSGVGESLSGSIFYDGPPGVLMFSAGVSKSHEVFTNQDDGKMQMLMSRYNSQITPVKLLYNAIGLSFNAKVKDCVFIKFLKDAHNNLLICDQENRNKNITEKWYYLGEDDAKKNGVLSDGMKVGDKSYLKIIRGEKNFQTLWEKFKSEDNKAMILEMEDIPLGQKLLEYKRSDDINLEFEINKDSAFPGLLR